MTFNLFCTFHQFSLSFKEFTKLSKYGIVGKSEAVRKSKPEVLYKNDVLKISQNSQENSSARGSFLVKLHPPGM